MKFAIMKLQQDSSLRESLKPNFHVERIGRQTTRCHFIYGALPQDIWGKQAHPTQGVRSSKHWEGIIKLLNFEVVDKS